MPYEEIAVADIDSNPFQIRTGDNPAVVGIATTAALNPKLGILQPPLVRPYGGRYQISFGHGRVEAAKLNGYKKLWCRVEELTDAEMKKHVLVENANRSDLSHEELMVGLEQYREELGLDKDTRGFYTELSKQTGIVASIIARNYKAEEMYQYIQEVVPGHDFKPPIATVEIVSELPKKVAYAILSKADDMKWNQEAVRVIKNAMENLSEEAAQYLIHDKRTRTPYAVIEAVSTLPNEQQMDVANYIKRHSLNEENALGLIGRVKDGDAPQDVVYLDKYERVLDQFNDLYSKVSGLGYNHMMIMGNRWSECLGILDNVEAKINEIRALGRRHLDPG